MLVPCQGSPEYQLSIADAGDKRKRIATVEDTSKLNYPAKWSSNIYWLDEANRSLITCPQDNSHCQRRYSRNSKSTMDSFFHCNMERTQRKLSEKENEHNSHLYQSVMRGKGKTKRFLSPSLSLLKISWPRQ